MGPGSQVLPTSNSPLVLTTVGPGTRGPHRRPPGPQPAPQEDEGPGPKLPPGHAAPQLGVPEGQAKGQVEGGAEGQEGHQPAGPAGQEHLQGHQGQRVQAGTKEVLLEYLVSILFLLQIDTCFQTGSMHKETPGTSLDS